MGSILKRLNKVTLAAGTVWNTVVSFGVGDGVYCDELSGVGGGYKVSIDKSAGQGWEGKAEHGIPNVVNGTLKMKVQENDPIPMLLTAQIMGADSVSGTGAVSHKMTAQNESGLFFSLGWQEGEQVKHVASCKVNSHEFTYNAEGILELSVGFSGTAVVLGTSTDLDTVTSAVRSKWFDLSGLTFRINAQSGADFGTSDELIVSDFKVTKARKGDEVVASGGGVIMEPKEGDYPEWICSFKIPHKNTMAETLYAAFLADTAMKADYKVVGSTANFYIHEQFPQVFVETYEVPFDDIMPANVTLRLQKAAAAPTGMTAITMPTLTWKNTVAGSVL